MVEEEGKSQWVAELLRPKGDTRCAAIGLEMEAQTPGGVDNLGVSLKNSRSNRDLLLVPVLTRVWFVLRVAFH